MRTRRIQYNAAAAFSVGLQCQGRDKKGETMNKFYMPKIHEIFTSRFA